MSLFKVPKAVFVPFEWDGRKWVVRNDLPRFREPIEAAQYLMDYPEISFTQDKQQVYLQWQERNEQMFINEYLQGVGTTEQLSRH
jgi:hypothetical protein